MKAYLIFYKAWNLPGNCGTYFAKGADEVKER
jgi:hypothetical protein